MHPGLVSITAILAFTSGCGVRDLAPETPSAALSKASHADLRSCSCADGERCVRGWCLPPGSARVGIRAVNAHVLTVTSDDKDDYWDDSDFVPDPFVWLKAGGTEAVSRRLEYKPFTRVNRLAAPWEHTVGRSECLHVEGQPRPL